MSTFHHIGLPRVYCRGCGQPLDAATVVFMGKVPQPGDISICVNCSLISVYRVDLTLRPPTDSELCQFVADPRVIQALDALAKTMKPPRMLLIQALAYLLLFGDGSDLPTAS